MMASAAGCAACLLSMLQAAMSLVPSPMPMKMTQAESMPCQHPKSKGKCIPENILWSKMLRGFNLSMPSLMGQLTMLLAPQSAQHSCPLQAMLTI